MNLEFEKNKDHNKLLLSEINQLFSKIKLGGLSGKDNLKIKSQTKMTARERINFLIDNKSPYYEIGGFAGYEMYEDVGGCPSAGVVVVIGYICGKLCVIVANDSSVKAGSWFPITAKKNLRAQEISIENKIPIIYLVDSAGVYLPMQDEIFPDKYHFGRIFRNNAKMSSDGIVQIAAVMGSCVAGGAYLPIMSDESIIVNKTASIFLAGSYLVKAAIGEEIDNETLGGASTHSEISGITDHKASDDKDALNKIRSLISKIGSSQNAGFNRVKAEKPNKAIDEIYGILPRDKTKPYSSFDIIERLIDENSFDQYKADYGKTNIINQNRCQPKGVYQFFKVRRDNNTMIILNESETKELQQFTFPRQPAGYQFCLTDFIHPEKVDTLCFFVVTSGQDILDYAKELKEKEEFLASHIANAIGLELAEAFSEHIHQHIRSKWGFPDDPNNTIDDLFKLKFQGRRYSFGYPACPDLGYQKLLWDILHPDQHINVELCDDFMKNQIYI